jgi:hypothetical protein
VTTPTTPTLAGFLLFIRGQMGVSTTVLPDDSIFIVWAYNVAIELVNLGLQAASPTVYMLAVYNLAASNLVNFAQDQAGNTYFADLRRTLQIDSMVPELVTSASDQGTSSSYFIPDFYKNISLADLQYLKDPWGRQYLAFAQRYGTLWGLN